MGIVNPYGERETFQADDAQSVLSRTWLVFRQAVNEGIGLLVIGMLLLSLAALAGRIAWTTGGEYNTALMNELDQLTTPNEPRRDDPYVGLISFVLAPINSNHTGFVDSLTKQPSYLRAVSARTMMVFLMAEVSQRVVVKKGHAFSKSAADLAAAEILNTLSARPALSGRSDVFTDAGWRKRALTEIAAVLTQQPVDLALSSATSLSVRDSLLGRAWTHDASLDGGGISLVPGFCAPAMNKTAHPQWPLVPATGSVDERLRAEAQASRLFDIAIRFAVDEASSAQPDSFDLYQAYWVSMDQILDLWHRRSPTGAASSSSVDQLPMNRYWAAASYSESLMVTDRERYTSHVYADYAGGGLVLTVAEPIVTHATGYLGVIATDFRFPARAFLERLARESRLLRVILVETQTPIASADSIRLQERKDHRWRRWWQLVLGRSEVQADADWAPLIKDKFEADARSVLSSTIGNSVRAHRIATVPIKKGRGFLIPLSDPSDPHYVAALVVPRPPYYPTSTWVGAIGAILSLCGSLGCFAIGLQLSARTSELERRRGLLRGIQVGVVRLDNDDRIIEANDRAEELLARRLPKMGLGAMECGEVYLSHIIEDGVAIEDPDETVASPRRWQWGSFSRDVLDERRRGKICRYIARSHVTARLIDITASPVLAQDRHRQEAVGVLWSATDATEAAILEQRIIEAKKYPKGS